MPQNRTQRPNAFYALIMAGGEGTRFAPLSTPEKPKQFLKLIHPEKTLLQQSVERLDRLFEPQNILVATNQRYVPLVKEQLPFLNDSQIFGETQKKNTAPCLAWVSFQLMQRNKNAVLMAIPSDQFITPEEVFCKTIRQAFEMAEKQNAIVTIGIPPTFASTHHGYLHKENNRVKEFVEKPPAETAKQFLKNGNYFWNGGTFIFPVAKMVEAFQKFMPEIYSLLEKETRIEDFFEKTPSISIDYAVMEKSKDLLVVEAPFTWSDVGTWESLANLAKQHNLSLAPEVVNQLRQK